MEGGQSFLDLLDFGGSDQLHESPIEERETPPTQKASASVKAKFVKGKNWSSEEDKVLIDAWANTSLDAVVGTDQHSHSYWGRISEYYNAHKRSSWSERNANALSCRYTTISASTSKFCACLQQILNKNESGRTISEKERDAHELYIAKDPKGKPFTLMHCYIEFEKYPKWTTRSVPQKKQKKTSEASPGTTSNDEDFGVCTDYLENEKRPHGTKQEKILRKGKNHASAGSDCKFSLQNVWEKKLERDEIKEATKSARYARAFELQEKQLALQEREEARKEFELEEKIMFVDTSGMSDAQKQFYKDKQVEIIARRNHTSS